MGWEDCHLHQFSVGAHKYEVPDPEDLYASKSRDERQVKLNTLVEKVGTEFGYLYDFGDGWGHGLKSEAILLAEPGEQYLRCTSGARSGPPEDSGGPYGYQEYLEALADPTDERHEELLEWRGPFDSEAFDVNAINQTFGREFRLRVRPRSAE